MSAGISYLASSVYVVIHLAHCVARSQEGRSRLGQTHCSTRSTRRRSGSWSSRSGGVPGLWPQHSRSRRLREQTSRAFRADRAGGIVEKVRENIPFPFRLGLNTTLLRTLFHGSLDGLVQTTLPIKKDTTVSSTSQPPRAESAEVGIHPKPSQALRCAMSQSSKQQMSENLHSPTLLPLGVPESVSEPRWLLRWFPLRSQGHIPDTTQARSKTSWLPTSPLLAGLPAS